MPMSKNTFFVTATLLLFSSYTVAGPNYESSWHEAFHLGITKTLAKNDIRGCGQYKYKANLDFPDSEFLVYCTRDGSNWTAYQVWTAIDKVEGPFKTGSNFKEMLCAAPNKSLERDFCYADCASFAKAPQLRRDALR